MSQSRRSFLGAASACAAASAWGATLLFAQDQGQTAPSPIDPISPGSILGPLPDRTLSPSERMKLNQAQIKKDMARLGEMVGQLQKGLDKHDTTSELSLDVIRQTEEIERLARQIRSLVRG